MIAAAMTSGITGLNRQSQQLADAAANIAKAGTQAQESRTSGQDTPPTAVTGNLPTGLLESGNVINEVTPSIDQSLLQVMKANQSYQASAEVIKTAKQMQDQLIDIME